MTPPASAAATASAPPRDRRVVRLIADDFVGEVDGRPVALYTLVNARGGEVSICNLGAKLVQWLVPDRDGVLGDIVLGYGSLAALRAGHPSLNAFIGRYANRIGGAAFTLDGERHRLSANEGRHALHGGARGSRLRVFGARRLSPGALELRHVFDDGEEGFPGRLPLTLTCTLHDDHRLSLEWQAGAEGRATVASFTGHGFFNLAGDPSRPVLDHVVEIDADCFLPVDAERLPTGEIRAVAGTPMDFRHAKPLGQDLAVADEQLARCGGYDHFFVRRSFGADADARALARAVARPLVRAVARVVHPASGRRLDVFSTEPGLQLYSGNHLGSGAAADVGKGGIAFARHGGLCLEPSRYPDAPNQPGFPSAVVRPGQTYRGRIEYRAAVVPRSS